MYPRRVTPYVPHPDTPVSDLLDLVHASDWSTLATWNASRGTAGEWDTLRHYPLRVRRRLAGAGYLARHGDPPDVFADRLVRVFGESTVGPDPIGWYVRTALVAIRERQRAARYRRHHAVARAHGYPTYWHYRKARRAAL